MVIASSSPRNSKRGKSVAETKNDTKTDVETNATEAAKPLAPPPRPVQQGNGSEVTSSNGNKVDKANASLSLEPNPFEQSFGAGGAPETPGGTKLPSVAALTSPSSLLPPGTGNTPFTWGGGSLRTGPLSPAMLSGPAPDYFSESHHLRAFPTPNESSLRTGLTPGGSGSMFPAAASPNSQAMLAQFASGGATPSTLDFHRTALSAAAKRDQQSNNKPGEPQQQPPPPQIAPVPPQEMANGAPAAIKAEPKAFDPHDNDAANGLFMLAQGGNGTQGTEQFAAPGVTTRAAAPSQSANVSPPTQHINGGPGSGRGVSEGSNGSEESEPAKPATRGKKRAAGAANGRRKADDVPAKAPANKKAKGPNGAAHEMSMDSDDDDDDMKQDEHGNKTKMTEEEKRKNFLERNRVAALKCRQRKKLWLANLQSKVEMFSSENDALTQQITSLREEVVNLKTLLLAHKDCPVTQQQGMHGGYNMNQVVEAYNPQMHPYGIGAPMPNQQVMAGNVNQRRFS